MAFPKHPERRRCRIHATPFERKDIEAAGGEINDPFCRFYRYYLDVKTTALVKFDFRGFMAGVTLPNWEASGIDIPSEPGGDAVASAVRK